MKQMPSEQDENLFEHLVEVHHQPAGVWRDDSTSTAVYINQARAGMPGIERPRESDDSIRLLIAERQRGHERYILSALWATCVVAPQLLRRILADMLRIGGIATRARIHRRRYHKRVGNVKLIAARTSEYCVIFHPLPRPTCTLTYSHHYA